MIWKRVLIVFYVIICFLGCSNNKIPEGVNPRVYTRFMKYYSFKWDNNSIDEELVFKKVKNFLGDKFTVIWQGDMDADDVEDYVVVVKHKEIHHGIIKGMIIDKKGTIKLYIDREKGFYAPEAYVPPFPFFVKQGIKTEVFSFKRIGVRTKDVKCIRLWFTDESFKTTKSEHKKRIKEYGVGKIKGKRFAGFSFGFSFTIIDQNNNLIGIIPHWFKKKKDAPYMGYFMLDRNINHYIDEATMTFTIMSPDIENEYKDFKKAIRYYYQMKAKGIVVKSINFKP